MKTGKLFAIYVKAVLDHFHLPASPAVVRLLVMIAAHESGGFRYVTQIGNGPAKGPVTDGACWVGRGNALLPFAVWTVYQPAGSVRAAPEPIGI